MKAILIYPLYRRPEPTNKLEAKGYFPEGSVIDIYEITHGAEIEGISIWVHSTDGFYYWGGGLKILQGTGLISWNMLSIEVQQAVLSSVVNDEAYWIEKKVIGSLGYGMGYKNDNEASGLALSIFVDAKISSANLPKTIIYNGIEGIPIDVKPVQRIEHHAFNPDSGSPMQMGGSISPENGEDYGTRSLILRDRDNEIYLMTCFHVLLNNFKDQKMFPFPNSPKLKADYPGREKNSLGKKIRKENIVKGLYSVKYDFALVILTDKTDLMNAFDNHFFNGFHTSSSLPSLLNKKITMAGATSNIQEGKVLDAKAKIFVGPEQIPFDNVVVTEKISMPGDSGAPVLDEDKRIVGIIIAGNKEDRSFVLPIYNIVFQQGYSIVF